MLSKKQEILLRIFKNKQESYNSRSISKPIGISHAGAFKILKNLEKQNVVTSRLIGKARIYSINSNNPVALKEIELALAQEAEKHKKWIEEFKEISNKSKFIVLFGSVLRNEKEARDVDILIIAEKSKHEEINKVIKDKNKILNKKIHQIIQTDDEFKKDTGENNKAMFEIIKGVVLFGQSEFVRLLK